MRVELVTPLRVEKLPGDAARWRVLAPFVALVDGERVKVPAGYETDFASVPRLPLAYLVFSHHAHAAALLHDWLYSIGRPRAWADRAFRAAMACEGVAWWRRWAMFAGVRLFGWTCYAGGR